MKIGSVRLVLHFRASVTLYPYFSHLLSVLDEFQRKRSTHNAAEYFWALWTSAKEDRVL